ncbi:hypothetical protein Curi_c14670 [Gottschalkia acidurici 9a]|uniref:Uncharacterized protein n=1 Tax=Gottschalkia acidurici (strain ATCC 7906 / DSM 604 / BCRC 14475 / CIP 104303 / KCTC 5404 / NCIMB 10678 / 9a) TaxID=1128398 RepID=K0B0A4_GOTA9|nr:hypothetical protein [Gottschalkia acidurici]AFS78477.1 hypothetical protein Curi_c14670 [Gottschalkia acidurici 9a]
MKKYYRNYIIIFLIIIGTVIVFREINIDKYKKIKSTNLSKENINGVYLMQKYDAIKIENIFGELFSKSEDKDYSNYIYSPVSLKVDRDNNIIGIYTVKIDTSLKTTKGITKGISSEDVEKAYGNNFLKKEYSDFMGSSDGYFITYADKNNKIRLSFEFNEHSNWEVCNISFYKY